MSEFHIGEKVKCTDNFFEYPCKDKIGRIIDYKACDDNVVGVEFEDYVHGHSCSGRGYMGHCLFLPENLLISADIKSNIPLLHSCNIKTNIETKTVDNEFATENNHIKAKPEFTDKEILDSLYTHSCHECTAGCLLEGHDDCMPYLPTFAIELLQSQQRKIDTIEKENEKLRLTIKDVSSTLKELIKEIKVATDATMTDKGD